MSRNTLATDAPLVLVVEDNPELNRSICESLASEYRIASASNSREGLRLAFDIRPDVILTEVGMGGDELVHAVRAQGQHDRTAIVLLTAIEDGGLRARLLREGAQDYLTKPFSPAELRSRVGNLLAARRAREAEARLAMLFDHAPDGIFVADLDGRYTDVNAAGCRMLGYAREEIIGKCIVDLIPPDQVVRLRESKARMLEGAVHVAEWLLRRKDGTYLPVEVSASIQPGARWLGFVRDITGRKHLEGELRQSQERFELALAGANLAAWDWNIETGEVIFNPRWAQMRGFRPEQIRPHVDSWVGGVHPDDLPLVQKVLQDHFQGRASEYRAEHRVRTASGAWLWILDLGRVFAWNERGEPTRMVGVELDIHERKRLEAELRLAEAKSSGILSIAADAIISIDEAQRITMFNDGAEKIFGWSKAQAIGMPLDVLIPERFRADHRVHVERFAAGQEIARRMGEQRAGIVGLRKNGEEFPADAAISRLQVGGTLVLTVALRDMTVPRRIEQEQQFLLELGALLASTLDHEETLGNLVTRLSGDLADVCIVEAVADGGHERRLLAARNRQAIQGDGFDRAQPEPAAFVFGVEHPLLLGEVTPAQLDAIVQSEPHRRVLHELGPKSLMALPLFSHARVLGVLVLIRTTADNPYTQEDFRFAQTVAFRAALAIENACLYKTAQRAIQARDDVLGVVAHDLRNPLGMMLMQAALLRRRDGPRDAVAAIERAGSRMNRLIEDLLDVTRIDAGSLAIEPSLLATEQVIADVRDAQKPLIAAAKLELRVELAPRLPEVWADRERLLQVFENLVGNALKFTEPGGRITVGAAPRAGALLFWVADTGAGIVAEDLPHLFDRFWQARKAGRHGAGLGLAIVKGIVEAHGGRVWAESTPGRGSTFYFTMPTASRLGA